MNPRDVILKKRDGGTLTAEDIAYFVRGYMDSSIADYHMSALLMAIYLNGMSIDETHALMCEMRRSGKVLDLSGVPGRKIDKHSTGGVGDKTSIMIAPIAAACGVIVPMVTGRALGHTGGTLDKIQSIPGFNPRPSPAKIQRILKQTGAVLMGQTDDLAPADRRIYALRDVTGTVESIPLITASILSKKLASGLDGLVMDVKTGSGALIASLEGSTELAKTIAEVCRREKTRVTVLITDMEQPLGRMIGNALEVRECIEFMHGRTAPDLEEVTLYIAAYMIRMGGGARSFREAHQRAYEAVSSGKAAHYLRNIIRLQGGDERVLDEPGLLPGAAHTRDVRAAATGYISRCDAKLLGLATNALGAGRVHIEDVIDRGVGIDLKKKLGDPVRRSETLCTVHWNDDALLQKALPMIRKAYEISARRTPPAPVIQAVLGG